MIDTKNSLEFMLPVLKQPVELLRTNGIAEKVFTEKLPDKPYTWMANVVSVATKSIGSTFIGEKVRDAYIKTDTINIPEDVRNLPIADVNTMLVEIHRRVWENLLKRQETLCKYCGHKMYVDIDLNRINLSDEDIALSESVEEFSDLYVDLKFPFKYIDPSKSADGAKVAGDFDGHFFNRLVFDIPRLKHALIHEKYVSNTISFWRRVAFECLQKILFVDDKGEPIEELPIEVKYALRTKLFDLYLDASDLKNIRETLRNSLPTMPFFYEETCTSCKRETPVTLESSSFFSE